MKTRKRATRALTTTMPFGLTSAPLGACSATRAAKGQRRRDTAAREPRANRSSSAGRPCSR